MLAARLATVAALALVCAAPASAESAPVAVSPGSSTGASVSDPCPTFSWGRIEGALSYELVVYHVGEEGEEADPVLEERISGSALGWTPSLDRCLDRGEPYAWSVRAATGEGASEWAAPLVFEVALRPSEEELAAALEVVRRHLATGAGTHDPGRAGGRSRDELVLEPRAKASGVSASPAAAPVGAATAQVTVQGEVRTVDSGGKPRLWAAIVFTTAPRVSWKRSMSCERRGARSRVFRATPPAT